MGVIHKIQSRIDGWQAKLLSRGGRLVLVNAVLTNIPLFYLSTFKEPKWVIKRIEALQRDFFWKGSSHTPGKGSLIAWKNVCISKKEGGLGILDLAVMNQALLAKWWWKFHTAPQLQWSKIIRDLYYRKRRPLKEGRSFRPRSHWWKGVLCHSDIFKWGVYYKLGNGSTIDFWLDRWCGEKTLQLAYPEVYDTAECKTVKVKDCLGSGGWNWNMILGGEGVGNQVLSPTWSEF